MTPERLNRRVSYQEPAEPADSAPDALGQTTPAWPTLATVWAEVRTPTGRETQNAGQLQGTLSAVVTVRRARTWFPRATGRFVLSSPVYDAVPRTLNILAAFDQDTGREWVTCLCGELAEPENDQP